MISSAAKIVNDDQELDLIEGSYDHDSQQFICEGGYASHMETDPRKGLIVTMSTNPLAKDISR
jgi:hypothetical protein